MSIRALISRTVLVGIALATGVAFTAPSYAANKPGQDLRICIKLLKEHKCIRI